MQVSQVVIEKQRESWRNIHSFYTAGLTSKEVAEITNNGLSKCPTCYLNQTSRNCLKKPPIRNLRQIQYIASTQYKRK